MTTMSVLEVGGTHVTGARVDPSTWDRPAQRYRLPLRCDCPAEEFVSTLAACARALGPSTSLPMAVAMPGPFDYDTGVARFHGVGKFDALDGVDVRRALLAALPEPPRDIVFLNDAAAFGLGVSVWGEARGHDRAVAITLGTGVGSAFVADGRLVGSGPTVPRDGEVHWISIEGRPLEQVVSRRAIIAAYQRLGGPDAPAEVDVREIAERALAGAQPARTAIHDAFLNLGRALAPWLTAFEAEALVVGGGISASWELIVPSLRQGLGADMAQLKVVRAEDAEGSTAVGAAWYAASAVGGTR